MRIKLLPDAEAELAEAADWYEARSKGLGGEFLRAVDGTISAIKRNPRLYPVVFSDVRRAVTRRFPYNVIYAVTEDEVLILACMHGRRDPRRWQERVEKKM